MTVARKIAPYVLPFLAGLGILIGLLYLYVAWTTAPGRVIAPLDDAYITFQYARQIALGQPYRYNSGEPYTTGMTSPLFGFLLAGVYLLGFTGEHLVAFAVTLGLVWLPLIAWLTARLTARLLAVQVCAWPPGLAALLAIFSGALQWSCFNGMETGLFTVAILAALDALLAHHPARAAVWLGVAGLLRPEGLILALIAWGVYALDGLLRERTLLWRALLVLSGGVLAGLLPSFINWALTGHASAAGYQAKAWLNNVPFVPESVLASIAHGYYMVMGGSFLGRAPGVPGFVPPGLLMIVLLGGVTLGLRRRWRDLALVGLWFFGGTLASALLITTTWHVGRYQAPFVPVALALTVCALAWGGARARHGWQQLGIVGVGVFLLGSALFSTVQFWHLYRQVARTLAAQQLVISDWLHTQLPADAVVGVHDVGSLRYVGQHTTYDLVGLTTPRAALPWRNGAGSVFELMERAPNRPDYFAIYPDVFSLPYFVATDLFAEELFWVDVPDAIIASAGPVQGVWRADWRLAGSGDALYQPDILAHTQGLRLVAALDVADLDAEAAHAVTWWPGELRPGFPTELWQLRYQAAPEHEVLDGGRLLTGGFSFTAATTPGEPLWLVARLHPQSAGAVEVEVNGVNVGRWAYPPAPGAWLETLFPVPAAAMTGAETQITLRVAGANSDFRHYALYYLWALQGEPLATLPAVQYPTPDIVYADDLRLAGFALPHAVWRPGDTLPLTLYWKTAQRASLDAKVFVHLYDAAGELGPQSDGWAYYGTRPPYTWMPGELISDPHALYLPPDLSSGEYTLAVGLYHPDGAGRLPALRAGVPQPEGRVVLTTLTIAP